MSERQYEQLKKKLHEQEADFALSHVLDEASVDDVGDYILVLGKDNPSFSHAEAVVFRIHKNFWGKKSYKFGLFPRRVDHEIFLATQGIPPISSVSVPFVGKWHIHPCPANYASDVTEWVSARKEMAH